MMTKRKLKGFWMTSSGVRTGSTTQCEVLVVDGKLWPCEVDRPVETCSLSYSYGDPPLELSEDGDLEFRASLFSPAEGELERVGFTGPRRDQ